MYFWTYNSYLIYAVTLSIFILSLENINLNSEENPQVYSLLLVHRRTSHLHEMDACFGYQFLHYKLS